MNGLPWKAPEHLLSDHENGHYQDRFSAAISPLETLLSLLTVGFVTGCAAGPIRWIRSGDAIFCEQFSAAETLHP
ncbi:MAG TPA: hypothetical protein PLV45_08420 [bacterium]|nr:hypothetical protein [bacterium]